jgi:YD repeat-containing protein
VDQSVDRWGNVLSLTDARDDNWTTRFTYNANNQLLETIRNDGVKDMTTT